MWKDNRRRHTETIPTYEVMHTYPADYKVVFVGDASMSPYEIVYPGGSVEHWNEEAGDVWMNRILQVYEHAVWLNPVPEQHWHYSPSTDVLKQIMGELGGFIGKLDSVVEGDGTMLDNLALLGTSGVSLGRTHSLDEYPLVMAGSACGFLKQDVHYRSETRENASKVMLTLQRAMGMTTASYGAGDAFTDEPLTEIER